VFENGVLERIFDLRGMKWAGHVARKEREGKVYRVLVGKQEGKRPHGKPRSRW
jgi:hypothetical protein